MNYEELSETILLDYRTLKIALYEECKPLFENYPALLDLWKHDAYVLSYVEAERGAPDHILSESFTALYKLFTESLFDYSKITKRMVRFAVENYKDTIINSQFDHIKVLVTDNVSEGNLQQITKATEQEFIYANAGTEYHLMRNIVTQKSDFTEGDTDYLGAELVDNQGILHGLAELRPIPLIQSESDNDQAIWIDLVETTLNSLDELTADIFDLISYLWMTSKKDSEGFIEFHSEDALILRNYDKTISPEKMKFRERERFNIMRRVAALTSIWVSLNEGSDRVKIVNAKDLAQDKLYKFQNFKRMFEVGSVRVAFDKKTNKPRGIYALQIKPSTLLQPYLDGTKSSLGVLDLKVFQYNHFKQREHKRLTRYLSRQWKIRTIKGTLQQPFKISTLIKEMNFPARLNGVQLRDRFEEILDDLMRDGILQQWHYNEEIDELKVGKRGWIQNYWGNINITILPPSDVVKENKRQLEIPFIKANTTEPTQEKRKEQLDVIDAEYVEIKDVSLLESKSKQSAFVFDIPENVTELSPDIINQRIDDLGYSLRKAAAEIGIAHTTLSRYINHKIKRLNKNNDQKMMLWMTMNSPS